MSLCQATLDPVREVRRADARLRLHLPARLILLDRKISCVLENISRTGARLKIQSPLEKGEFGQIQCDALDHFFETVWCNGTRAGIAFDEPIANETLLALRQRTDNIRILQRQEIKTLARSWVSGETH